MAEAKAAFFPDRGYASLLAQGRAGGLPERELAALERWLPSGRVDQKRRDAVAMLEAMRDLLATDPPPARADVAVERTIYWERAEAAFRSAAGPVLTALRLNPAECERLGEDELREWYFASVAGTAVPADLGEWIRMAGYADPDEFHRDAFAEYLRRTLAPGSTRGDLVGPAPGRRGPGTRFRLYPQVPIPSAAVASRRSSWSRRPSARCTRACRRPHVRGRRGRQGTALRRRRPAALSRRRVPARPARPRRPLRPPRAGQPCLHGRAHVRHDPLRPRRLGALSRR